MFLGPTNLEPTQNVSLPTISTLRLKNGFEKSVLWAEQQIPTQWFCETNLWALGTSQVPQNVNRKKFQTKSFFGRKRFVGLFFHEAMSPHASASVTRHHGKIFRCCPSPREHERFESV